MQLFVTQNRFSIC